MPPQGNKCLLRDLSPVSPMMCFLVVHYASICFQSEPRSLLPLLFREISRHLWDGECEKERARLRSIILARVDVFTQWPSYIYLQLKEILVASLSYRQSCTLQIGISLFLPLQFKCFIFIFLSLLYLVEFIAWDWKGVVRAKHPCLATSHRGKAFSLNVTCDFARSGL